METGSPLADADGPSNLHPSTKREAKLECRWLGRLLGRSLGRFCSGQSLPELGAAVAAAHSQQGRYGSPSPIPPLLLLFFDVVVVVVVFSWRAAMQVPRCYISYELITKSVPLPPPFFPTPERERERDRERSKSRQLCTIRQGDRPTDRQSGYNGVRSFVRGRRQRETG